MIISFIHDKPYDHAAVFEFVINHSRMRDLFASCDCDMLLRKVAEKVNKEIALLLLPHAHGSFIDQSIQIALKHGHYEIAQLLKKKCS